jgi:hypothetical protein
MKPRRKPGWIVGSHPPRGLTIARSRWPAQSDARMVVPVPQRDRLSALRCGTRAQDLREGAPTYP